MVITGADGFMGRNLRVQLGELGHHDVVPVTRSTASASLSELVASADFVFHLAGVNRPTDVAEFDRGNRDFTAQLCDAMTRALRPIPIVYASSTQATLDNPYGRSKLAAEKIIARYGSASGARYHVLRFPNIFGKWSRPSYNSVVATFCHNLARGLPITVKDPNAALTLIYIDDAVEALVALLDDNAAASGEVAVGPVHQTTVGSVADTLQSFVNSRRSHVVPSVGTGLTRALWATYLSFLPPSEFCYALESHVDPRGAFVELLKHQDSGQISYFTAHPGITRGEHYHHSKTEKFLVVKGNARFGFRHILTNETYHLDVSGDLPSVVETVPGWAHNVTNIGTDEMIVLLWANEVFDARRPDTVAAKVAP